MKTTPIKTQADRGLRGGHSKISHMEDVKRSRKSKKQQGVRDPSTTTPWP